MGPTRIIAPLLALFKFVIEPMDINKIPTKIAAEAMKKSNDTHENCKDVGPPCGRVAFPKQFVHDHSALLKQLPQTARPQFWQTYEATFWPHSAQAGADMFPHLFINKVGSRIKARTNAINTIARTNRVFVDPRSEPNTIGIGPINKTPPPRVSPIPCRPLIATMKMATNANMTPKITSASPICVREIWFRFFHSLTI